MNLLYNMTKKCPDYEENHVQQIVNIDAFQIVPYDKISKNIYYHFEKLYVIRY